MVLYAVEARPCAGMHRIVTDHFSCNRARSSARQHPAASHISALACHMSLHRVGSCIGVLRTLKTLPASRASVSLLKASPSVNAYGLRQQLRDT